MHTKTSLRFGLSVSVASLALCVILASSPAQAGFQWVPPEQAASVPAAPMMSSPAPALQQNTFPNIAPKIIEAPSAAVNPEAMKAQVRPFVFPSPDAPEEKVVLGFANNVPLSVALRQVLPPAVGFSVGEDVSLGTLVSWRGGSPWRQVLREMLLPSGLISVENGALVKVVKAGSASLPVAMPSMPADRPHMLMAPKGLPSHGGNGPDDVLSGVAAMPMTEGQGASVQPVSPSFPEAMTTPMVDGEIAAPAMMPQSMPPMTGGQMDRPVVPTPQGAGQSPMLLSAPMPLTAPSNDSAYPSMGYLAPPEDMAVTVPSIAEPAMPYGDQSGGYDVWTAERGQTLRQVIQKWCERARVDLSWQSEYDYPLQASVALSGGFEEAIRGLLAGFQEAKPQPVGRLHKNEGAAQTVLVVEARGNKYND